MMRLVLFMTARIEANSRFVCPVGDSTRSRLRSIAAGKAVITSNRRNRQAVVRGFLGNKTTRACRRRASHLTLPRNRRTVELEAVLPYLIQIP
jgi:hypothetical protein